MSAITDSKKKISLTFTPARLPASVQTLNDEVLGKADRSPSPPMATDHFLTIVPKPTLLGKQQAKKRLQAFSSVKTSPLKRKDKEEKAEDAGKEEKKAPKRQMVNPDDRAKGIIEEIESIKKHEQSFVEMVVRKHKLCRRSRSPKDRRFDRKKDYSRYSNSKHHSDERHHEKRRSPTPEKYPADWAEVVARNLSFDKLRQLELQKKSHSTEMKCGDAIKMMRFRVPPVAFSMLRYRKLGPQDEYVPGKFVRYTSCSPKISYSCNYNRIKSLYYTRRQICDVVSREQRESLQAIIHQSSLEKPILPGSPLHERKWYTKPALSSINPHCEILEQSLGLSILQSYSDNEERDAGKAKREYESEHDEGNDRTKQRIEEKRKHEENNARNVFEVERSFEQNENKSEILDEGFKHEESKVMKGYTGEILEERFKHEENKAMKGYKGEILDERFKREENKERCEKSAKLNEERRFNDRNDKNEDEEIKIKARIKEDIEINDEDKSKSRLKSKKVSKRKKEKKRERKKAKRASEKKRKKIKKKSKKRASSTEEEITEKELRSESDINLVVVEKTKELLMEDFVLEKEILSPKLIEEKIPSSPIIEEPNFLISFPDIEELRPKIVEESVTKNEDEKIEELKVEEPSKLVEQSPDTDEYHSHWESEDEAPPKRKGKDNSWESDEEEVRVLERPKPVDTERSLEMPLNINFRRTREFRKFDIISEDSWERGEYLKFKNDLDVLEESRRTLSEERKLLEIEKQKVAEMERRLLQNDVKREPEELTRRPERRRSRKSRWEDADPVKPAIKEEKVDEVEVMKIPLPSDKLEDEYEQFIKAVSTVDEPERKRDSSSSSSSSRSSSSSSSSTSETKKSDLEIPLPVPSPTTVVTTVYGKNLSSFNVDTESPNSCKVDSTSSPLKVAAIDLDNRKPIKSIVIVKKQTQLLDNSVFKDESDEEEKQPELPQFEQEPEPESQMEVEQPPIKRKELRGKREPSPKRRRSSPCRRSNSPRPRRRFSPRRRRESSPPRRRRDRDRFSRERSPRYRNRSLSPYRKRSRSSSKERKGESIQQTLTRLAGMDYETRSPVNSPLDGFKRSLADSTISDEQLMQNQEDYNSPYYNNNVGSTSPKRISLDDRINQVLGLEKEEPKPISTTYSQNFVYNTQGYYEQYGQYNMNQEYDSKTYDFEIKGKSRVVQVGNMLQVVPTEEIPTVTPIKEAVECSQKILQVGNMLQIVPTPILPTPPVLTSPVKEKQSAEEMMKGKIAERKAEREKRRQERERRRKEKEKKRKEREKRRQLKVKQKTEEMIKRALQIEAELNEEIEEPVDTKEVKLWPAIPTILTTPSRPVGKSILVLNRKSSDPAEKPKKGVKFADGIIPGEGTSPSGGEELSSPPPISVKLMKEKRFTKTKKPKKVKQPKKKVKVKIVRKSQPEVSDDEEDNLLPPSPPPGSPPPHVFPPRMKVALPPPPSMASGLSAFSTPPPPSPVSYHHGTYAQSASFTQHPPPPLGMPPPPIAGVHLQPPLLPPPQHFPPPPNVMHHVMRYSTKSPFNTSISPPQQHGAVHHYGSR